MQESTLMMNILEKSAFFYTIVIGMDGKYANVSSNYDKNFDFLGDSLLGKPFSITLHPNDVEICEQAGKKCFENPNQLIPVTLRKHNGEGGYVFTQWEMKAQFDMDGNPSGIFCLGYNITEYVQTGEALTKAQTEIAAAHSKLSEIDLMHSHVFRKPLANIMGLSSILNTMELDFNQQNINKLLLESANELDHAIRGISSVS